MHPRSWSSSLWTLRCCLGSLRTSARCSTPKEAPWRHSLSPQCRLVLFNGSIPTSFVLLLRRLSLPLPLSSHSCFCGCPRDCRGHHRACCALSVLERRSYAMESAAARVCREAGARVLSVRNWPLSSLLSALMGNLTDGVQKLMVQLWWPLDAVRSVLILSWWETVDVPSWSCSLWRSADISLRRRTRLGKDSLDSRAVVHPCSPILGLQMGVCSGLCRSQGVCVFVAGSSGPPGCRRHHPSGAEVLADFSRAPLVEA